MSVNNAQSIKGYELIDLIGEGAFGAVYRAHQPVVDREVAIKIILPEYASQPDFIRRFESEAQLVAQLEHIHIVPLYDYWRDPEGAYLVMRLMKGGNLEQIIQKGPLPLAQVARFLDQVASALAAAHRRGIVHRDLKPANILLDEDGNAYLSDFGIAKALGEESGLTITGAILGTPAYITPEQAQSLPVSAQMDIYALGVVLYAMLTGAHPFPEASPGDLIARHLRDPLPHPVEVDPSLPLDLDAVIQRATAKDPAARYPDVAAMLADFREALGPELAPPPARPLTEELLSVYNPYKGLRAFQEADAEDFFGREALTGELLARLATAVDNDRFLAVVGPSGSGKSSVVKAGLLPALRKGALPGSEQWFIIEMVPGAHPLEEVELALLRIAIDPGVNLAEQLNRDERGLLRAARLALPGDDTQLTLVIDQFEELFTLVESVEERVFFLDSLYTAATDPTSCLQVVITLRADFYDRPLNHADFGGLIQKGTEVILPLSTEELQDAIRRPAERVGLTFEEGLVTDIVAEVVDQPGVLPLLQYALTELFERRDGRLLTHETYQSVGGVLGALGRRAEQVFASLDEGGQIAARQLFLRLVTLGEGVEDTRRRVLRSELEGLIRGRDQVIGDGGQDTLINNQQSTISTVIDSFGSARLLTFDHDPVTRGPTVEVAHEALLQEWQRLREWLDESRADIRMQRLLGYAANEWLDSGREGSFLLRGTRLDQFETWAASTDLALTEAENDYLEASLEERRVREVAEAGRLAREAAMERRSRNFLRLLVGVFALAALVAVVLTIFAFNQQFIARENALQAEYNAATAQAERLRAEYESDGRATQQALAEEEAQARATQQAVAEAESLARATAQAVAEEERAIALEQKELTQARELAFASAYNLEVDPERSVLLAIEAVKTKNIIEATNALHQALPELSVLNTIDMGGYIDDLDFNSDGARLAMAGLENVIVIWDIIGNQKAGELHFPVDSQGKDVAISPDDSLIAASGWTGQADLTLWDAGTGEVLHSWVSQPEAARSFEGLSGEVAFSPDGTRVAVANLDGAPHVLDVSTGEVVLALEGHSTVAEGLAYSRDGSKIATGDNGIGGEVIVWDAESGERLLVLEAGQIYSMAFSPDGSKVAAVGDDGILHVWDANTGEKLISPVSETAGYRAVIFSHDGEYIYTGGQDSTVRIWEASSGKNLRTLAGHSGVVISLALSPDGQVLVSGATNDVKYWDLTPGKELFITPSASGMTLTPDGGTLIVNGQNNTINRFDPHNGDQIDTFVPVELDEGESLGRLVFTPDGKYLIAAKSIGDLIVFDYETREQVMTLRGHAASLLGLDVSSDGRYLVTSGFDNKAILWDLDSGDIVMDYTEHAHWVTDVIFSPDDQQVISASSDATVHVWDPESGETLQTVTAVGPLGAIELTPDGKYVVGATIDGYVSIWEADSWEQLQVFLAHTSGSWDSDLSADGSRLVTAGFEGSAKVWDIPSGEPVATLYGHQANVTDVVISPDGKIVYTGAWDGMLRAFVLDVDDLIELAESRVTRSLTEEECRTYLHVDQCPEE
jgi:WD40 repeat protein